ncbi:hypothetical protein [uncultured Aquimarina sp.]|uniref:hypothetical protein n=1 Tax=uncultured Aquimarina sp. TaxID=575652 RepID=UPI00260AF5F9|nr:hypothetical protein [uncultured Aquimarina sp.]
MLQKILKIKGIKELNYLEKKSVLGNGIGHVCGSCHNCSGFCEAVFTGGAGCGSGGCCHTWVCITGSDE